jgi:arylsulfatase A-like enzyme
MVMDLRVVVGCVAGILAVAAGVQGQTPGPAAGRNTRPNVLVIVADDLGYADLGCQGAKDIATPAIDSLAANGVRFTDGYVSCPVCSPTRAGLNTGRYQQRFGHEFNPGPPAMAEDIFGLPLKEKTLANYMKEAGYVTGMVGKWHLGYKPEFHPMKRGFDEFFGFPGGAHSYIDPKADGANPILRGTQPVDEKEYLTDAFGREARAFIRRHAAEPFFLYLTFNAVHTPQQVPEKYLARFASIQDDKRRKMAAMLSAMDDAVAGVLQAVRDKGLENNTLIFFISDNGGPTPSNGSRNTPLTGYKGQVLEGGIRVPYIIQWKGRLPAGEVYRKPVISLDILPTAVAAVGGAAPRDVDGVNLLPYLTGRKDAVPHDVLFWRFGPQAAVRKGDYKLVMQRDQQPQLFNLAEDIGEQHDLAAGKPDLLKELKTVWDRWDSTLAKPLWQGKGRAAASRPAARRNPGNRGNAPQGRAGGAERRNARRRGAQE